MQTEFYRSQTELIPTFSLLLTVSLAGLNTCIRPHAGSTGHGTGASALPALARHAYYGSPERAPEPTEQLAALRRFAETLLSQTEDSPQAAVDVLNRHFWELV